jgi:ribosomal protein S18 acetylase RimI-like enzyme
MFKIREGAPSDYNLIIGTFLNGVKYGSSYFKSIDDDAFFHNYTKFVEYVTFNSDVKICCLEEDEDVIVGYVLSKGEVIHWIYTKPAFRKLGVANSLLAEISPTTTPTYTKVGYIIAKKKNIKLNPWIT